MTQIPDRLAALVEILKADVAVAAEVSTRVFGGELPAAETASMPRKAVVVSHRGAGAAANNGYQQHGTSLVATRCYGETPYEADSVWRAVHGALKQLRRTLEGDVYIYSASPAEGPFPLRDPDVDWPSVHAAFTVRASEVAHA